MSRPISDDALSPDLPNATSAALQRSVRETNVEHPALARLARRLEGHDPHEVTSPSTYSRDYSRSCFPAGTEVLLADGTTKPIEDLSVGDSVMGFDGSKKVPLSVEAMESPLRDHLCVLTFGDGTSLRLTQEHPVYTTEGWRSLSPASTAEENKQLLVGKLEIGDQVLTADGAYRVLAHVEHIRGDVQTYNIQKLSGYDNFYANGVLVHNKAQLALCGKCVPRFADFACITSPLDCLPPPGQAVGVVQQPVTPTVK